MIFIDECMQYYYLRYFIAKVNRWRPMKRTKYTSIQSISGCSEGGVLAVSEV